MVVPPVEVMFTLYPKKNPFPFMVGDGALDVPSIEIRFTLHPVHSTAGASPRPTIIDIVSRNRKREISHKNKKRPDTSGRKKARYHLTLHVNDVYSSISLTRKTARTTHFQPVFHRKNFTCAARELLQLCLSAPLPPMRHSL